MRDLSQQAIDQKDGVCNRPVELYQLFFSEETIYLADYPEDIEFFDENGNPVTYYRFPIERNKISTNVENEVDEVSVSFANVSKEMSSFVAHTKVQGTKVRILKVFLDADKEVINASIMGRGGYRQLVESVEGAGLEVYDNHVVLFEGYMDAPTINQETMSVNIVSNLDTLDKELPAGSYTIHCGWRFGDSETCGKTVPKRIGTVTSIDNSGKYQQVNYAEGSNDAIDYWKHGNLTIGNENRKIIKSGQGYVQVEYPFSYAQIGGSYEVKAGCDKSYDSGHGCTFWNNTQYYRGFLDIPKIRDIRSVI